MAVNTFTGATSSAWITATNWSLGTVPTSVDGHTTTFDAASPACTLGGNRACYRLDMTNYTGTLTFGTFTLNVYNKSIILGSGATLSMAGGYLSSYANGIAVSITSNGCYVPYLFLGGLNPHTITLLDDFNVGKLEAHLTTNVLLTLNGNKILVYDDWNLGTGNRQLAGTTVIEFTGSNNCLWGGTSITGSAKNPIIINKSGGTLTLREYITHSIGTITHTAGTVDTLTNNSNLIIQAQTTLNTSGMTWNNVYFQGSNTYSLYTFNSLFNARKIIVNLYNVYFFGSAGFTVDDFIINDIQNINKNLISSYINFYYQNVYTINNSISSYSNKLYPRLLQSSSATAKVTLIYNGTNANQEVINCDALRIDSSGGNKIWTLDGTITDSDNWGISNSSIVPVTVAYFG